MRVLITGISGFIPHHLAEHLIRKTRWEIIGIDKLTYASKGFKRLRDANLLTSERFKIYTWDLATPISEGLSEELGDINIIIHMAAETHVTRSIQNPVECIRNNVMSTTYLLEYARTLPNLKFFHYFGTDEVKGNCPEGEFHDEESPHRPGNPYSASKAASEDICLAYQNTYKIPLIISNLMNVFGERQHVEKFIPMTIKKILNDEVVEIHCNDSKVPGSRSYIHARNVASAAVFILTNGTAGEKYNISGECEKTNLEIAQAIAKIIGKKLNYHLVNPIETRPGNDFRYALDSSKLQTLGWKPPIDFDHSLERMVKWTLENPEWLSD